MKTVGIMSMQRIRNYGSFLQAYSLKKIIESLGYKVEFIDYKYEQSLVDDKKNIVEKIIKNHNIIEFYKKSKQKRLFAQKYDQEYLPKLGISNNRNYGSNIDALVIGSDEVFNCLQPYPVGFSRNLFGKGFEDKKVISYAGCFGHTTYEDIKKYNIEDELKKMFDTFSSISVRDTNSKKIIKKLTGKNADVHLDPVLIYDGNKTYKKPNISNYILVYAYPGRISKKEGKQIKEFAKKHNKRILCIGSYQRIADEILTVSPFELLSYFKYADFVITDTFHGSIFSVKTHTNFCTIIRQTNKNKLEDLLIRLRQDGRIIETIEQIENKYHEKIDFSETDKIIKKEKDRTINYLKNSL